MQIVVGRQKVFLVRVGPRIILLEGQPGKQSLRSKRSRADNSWADRSTSSNCENTKKKNRHSMTVCGYCCHYSEHCSKTNQNATKRAKYENVFGLGLFLMM